MSNKIIIRENVLRNIVVALLILLVGSFGGGYSLGASWSQAEETTGVDPYDKETSSDIAWLLEVVPSQSPRVLPALEVSPLQVVATSPPVVPSLAPPVIPSGEPPVQPEGTSGSEQISSDQMLTVCKNLPCQVQGEDWERESGFKPGTVKNLTEKKDFTTSLRARCEAVLSEAAPVDHDARTQLECIRTRHREAQCAVVNWNLQVVLPHDAKGKLIIRSAVVLSLLVDFHLNKVEHPNWIPLCVGDLRQQYVKLVRQEVKAYEKALAEGAVRDNLFELNFCAEQSRDINGVVFLDDFSRTQSLEGFEFPLPPDGGEILRQLACGDEPSKIISSAAQ